MVQSVRLVDMRNILESSSNGYSSDSGVCSMSTSLDISPILTNSVDCVFDPDLDLPFDLLNLYIEVPSFSFNEISLVQSK